MARLYDIEIEKQLADCIEIDGLDLENSFTKLPGDLAYWNERFARALKEHLMAKLNCDQIHSQLELELREKLLEEHGRTTEAMVAAAIARHPVWEEARLEAVKAEAEKARLYGVVDAIRAKRDMLMQIGALRRAEMERDPQLKEMHRGRRIVENE